MNRKTFLFYLFVMSASFYKGQFFIQGITNFGLNTSDKCISFVDIDADGDMDAFGPLTLQFWKNIGTNFSPSFVQNPSNFGLNPSFALGVDFVDIDHDGDMDAYTVYSGGNASLWKNNGTKYVAAFSLSPTNYGLSPSSSSIDFVDIDNDGDMDAFNVFNGLGGQFWINTGAVNTPSFSLGSDFGLKEKNCNVDFIDFDNDGDMDAFNCNGTYWKNIGTNAVPSFSNVPSNYGLSSGFGIRFLDADNDLDLDAFILNGTTSDYFENVKTVGLQTSSRKSVVNISPNPNNGTFMLRVISKAMLQITDQFGRLVFDSQFNDGQYELNLKHLASGIYYTRVNGDGVTQISKLVINK